MPLVTNPLAAAQSEDNESPRSPITQVDKANLAEQVDGHHSNIKAKMKGTLGAGRALRRCTLHKYETSPHLGASLWSTERKDVPMYFGHKPDEGRALSVHEQVVELFSDVLFVMLLPALIGLLPFVVPLGGKHRDCIIPGGLVDPSSLTAPPPNVTYANVTLPDQTISCAEIRTSTFLLYTCPFW